MTKDQAIRIALEALEKDPVPLNAINNAKCFLYSALEQPEQEPVAWWNPRYGKGEYAFAEEQSPPDDSNDPSDFGWNIPLYTAPPKREWQGLTDEDIAQGAKQSWVDKQAFESAVWWAEEKLREKNGF